MGRVYLVRHASHGLVGKVLSGRSPGLHLSPAGRAQAEGVAVFLSGVPDIGAVVSSPLARCLETAAPIAGRLGLAVLEDDALNEIDCGDWTGSPFDDLAADPRWRRWNSERDGAVAPGGESARAVQARIMTRLERCARLDERPAVMVTHGDVVKTVVLTLIGASLDRHDRVEIDPASITTIDLWPGGGKLVRSNQVTP